MKVTFEFDTDSELFDKHELQIYYQAKDMAHCLSEIENQLRSWYKYGEREVIPVEEVRDTIINIIIENVNLGKMGY